MEINKVLNELADNKISSKRAYKLLYKDKRPRRARFIKLNIITADSKGVNLLLKLLFLFPVPVSLLKLLLKNSNQVVSDKFPIEVKQLFKHGLYKKMFIKIKSLDGTKVLIKTI